MVSTPPVPIVPSSARPGPLPLCQKPGFRERSEWATPAPLCRKSCVALCVLGGRSLQRTKLDFREPRIPQARFPRRTLLIAGCSEVEPSTHGLVNACAAFPSEAHAAHRYAWVNNSATCCQILDE